MKNVPCFLPVIAGACLLLAGCTKKEESAAAASAGSPQKVRVSLFSWPGYAFWFIAKEKNLVPELDLEISIIEDPYESFAQMAAGKPFNFEEAARFMGVMDGDPPFGTNNEISRHWKLTNDWWIKFGTVKKEHPMESGVVLAPFKALVAEGL